MRTHPLPQQALPALLLSLTAVIFVLDLFTPLGFAHGILYVPVILGTLFCRQRKLVLTLTAATMGLTVLGYWLAPEPVVTTSIVLANRFFSLLTLAISGYLAWLVLEQLQGRHASQARFRQLTDAMPLVVWMADANGQVFFFNRALEEYTGLDGATIHEPPGWVKLLHPEDQARCVETWTRCVRERQPYNIEFRIRHHSGRYGSFLVRAVPVAQPDGTDLWYGTAMDITDYRRLQQQLHEAQKLESIGQLTGGVAHDFNNLLTVVQGNAQLLEEELSDRPELKELATMVSTAASQGSDLTQRLLAFARRQPLEPKVVDINRLISDFDPLLRRSLGETIETEWVQARGLWPAQVDPAQLESALLNLCLNARDAMDGRGRLTIETANASLTPDYVRRFDNLSPGQYVMVAVSDTGAGMDEDTQRQAIEPFYTTKQAGRGTGLGLSMVFGFLKQSGGHLNIYSELGEGTTVRLYLPRAWEDPAPAVTDEPAPHAEQNARACILLVEDDALVRQYAFAQLTRAGYQVITAEDGHNALAILASDRPVDLLFTDVVMPGLSGRELADQAREYRPGLAVLYTSGYTENAIVHQGRLDPGVRLLSKPYRREQLLQGVREAITGTAEN